MAGRDVDLSSTVVIYDARAREGINAIFKTSLTFFADQNGLGNHVAAAGDSLHYVSTAK
jgi:hypothetical protein